MLFCYLYCIFVSFNIFVYNRRIFAPLHEIKYSSSSIKLLILYDVFAFVGLQYILIWYNFYMNNKMIIEFGFRVISRN